jgi:hypothetical protein
LGRRDLVFINGLSASSSLYALKISASVVELGSHDDFWVGRDEVFVTNSSGCALTISASGVELGFEDYFWDNRDSVFIKVSQLAVVYVPRRCQHQA